MKKRFGCLMVMVTGLLLALAPGSTRAQQGDPTTAVFFPGSANAKARSAQPNKAFTAPSSGSQNRQAVPSRRPDAGNDASLRGYPPSDALRQARNAYRITLDGKAGTRPIGYDSSLEPDGFYPQELVLTYESATAAAASTAEFGVPGVYHILYQDSSDHGIYTLYVQVERLDVH
jgi:hypothetical protein